MKWEILDLCPDPFLFKFIGRQGIKLEQKKVLELGFGQGQNLFEMKKRGAKIYGIELKSTLVEYVREATNKSGERFPVIQQG